MVDVQAGVVMLLDDERELAREVLQQQADWLRSAVAWPGRRAAAHREDRRARLVVVEAMLASPLVLLTAAQASELKFLIEPLFDMPFDRAYFRRLEALWKRL